MTWKTGRLADINISTWPDWPRLHMVTKIRCEKKNKNLPIKLYVSYIYLSLIDRSYCSISGAVTGETDLKSDRPTHCHNNKIFTQIVTAVQSIKQQGKQRVNSKVGRGGV